MQKKVTKTRIFRDLRILTVSALLAAMSIVLGKYLRIDVAQAIRISFENLPIMMAGIFFGPVVGLAVGVGADIVGCLLVGFAINPYITAGAAAIGLLSGIMSHYVFKKSLVSKVASAVAASHLIGSVIIKTYGISSWYDMPLYELALWRLLTYTIIGAAEFFIIYTLMRSQAFSRELSKLTGKNELSRNA